MAVGAIARAQALPPIRSAQAPAAAAEGAEGAEPAPAPDADGVVRSDAAKAGYKAWLKGRMKAMFEDMIATATKRHH